MSQFELILENAYEKAQSTNEYGFLNPKIRGYIDYIVSKAENNRGIIAVLMTLLTYKIYDPSQDIRNHQVQIPNGFSGRSIDTKYITPWIKSKNFPAMAESGWLTRSLEQAVPYNLHYSGSIKPAEMKESFLKTIDYFEKNQDTAEAILVYYLFSLIKKRDSLIIDLAKPHSLPITTIIGYLEKHFSYRYSGSGAARLPVLALYSAYTCMMREVERYKDKVLLPLESHNSADRRSGRIGDIDVWNSDGEAYEGVEVKHEIQITASLVSTAYEKFKGHPTKRYYILTTANMDSADWDSINNEIDRIAKQHGCQVIVNGVYSSLKYYLRLLEDPAEFIDEYVNLLKTDDAVKYQHKEMWNRIINGEI